jgi:hypothetical protein
VKLFPGSNPGDVGSTQQARYAIDTGNDAFIVGVVKGKRSELSDRMQHERPESRPMTARPRWCASPGRRLSKAWPRDLTS